MFSFSQEHHNSEATVNLTQTRKTYFSNYATDHTIDSNTTNLCYHLRIMSNRIETISGWELVNYVECSKQTLETQSLQETFGHSTTHGRGRATTACICKYRVTFTWHFTENVLYNDLYHYLDTKWLILGYEILVISRSPNHRYSSEQVTA